MPIPLSPIFLPFAACLLGQPQGTDGEAGARWCSGMTESNPGGRCRARSSAGGLRSAVGGGMARRRLRVATGELIHSASWPGGLGIGSLAGVRPGCTRRCRSRVPDRDAVKPGVCILGGNLGNRRKKARLVLFCYNGSQLPERC